MDIFVDSAGALVSALGTTILMAVIAGIGSLLAGALIAGARISPIPLLRAAAFFVCTARGRGQVMARRR